MRRPNEVTGKRPSNYSRWHRPPRLPGWCCMTDGDWFEQRKCEGELQTVALIETIQVHPQPIKDVQHNYELSDSKVPLLTSILLRMRLPCFVVRHMADCSLFSVARFTSKGEEEAILMNEDEYTDFIQKLKPVYPCPNCGATNWWLRINNEYGSSEWLCGRCHPNPNSTQIVFDIPFNEPINMPFKET